MLHLIGDVQGCAPALQRLLAEIGFSPSRDRLVMLGDLVNRGPDSLGVLKLLASFEGAATCLLGNHDLHLLAVAHGVRKLHKGDTFSDVLNAPEREAWVQWVRQQPLAHVEGGWLCVHAGLVPQWTTEQTLALAAEVQTLLRGPDLPAFLQVMYGNEPRRWHDELAGDAHAHPLLQPRRHAGFQDQGRRRRRARGPAAVVRGARPSQCRPAHRLRPLEHAGPHEPARPAGHRHRLRLGRRAHRRACGRRTA
jgi:Calcineurin-like phosphoesterase